MEPVLRAIGCYLLLLFIVRLSGKRGLAQVTIFDLVLLLLISQTVGQALIGNDSSLTTAAISRSRWSSSTAPTTPSPIAGPT